MAAPMLTCEQAIALLAEILGPDIRNALTGYTVQLALAPAAARTHATVTLRVLDGEEMRETKQEEVQVVPDVEGAGLDEARVRVFGLAVREATRRRDLDVTMPSHLVFPNLLLVPGLEDPIEIADLILHREALAARLAPLDIADLARE